MLPLADLTLLRCHVSSRPWLAFRSCRVEPSWSGAGVPGGRGLPRPEPGAGSAARGAAGAALIQMRLLESRPLRWVMTTHIACRLPWTGSWTGAPDNPGAARAISAITRAISAASAHGARGRTSHNPPVVGSSPTRPTSSFDIRSAMAVDRRRWCDSSCRYSRPVT
jgi:hypothetical protein